jgi:hypothetical protein
MTQPPPTPPSQHSPSLPHGADANPERESGPERHREPRRPVLAPQWLQVVLIVGLLGAAVYVALDGRYLWAGLLAVAGLAFGVSYLLRRAVGDEYGRS